MSAKPPKSPDIDPVPDPDGAWKTLSLVNDWIKHAETKAGATLAGTGVAGGVLYNLVKDQRNFGLVLAVSASLCGLFIVLAGFGAVVALWPRLKAREEPTSRLYFSHIARRHSDGSAGYVSELRELVDSPDALVEELGQQIWSNSRVAHTKYRWASRATGALGVAVLALGVVALYLALKSIGVSDG